MISNTETSWMNQNGVVSLSLLLLLCGWWRKGTKLDVSFPAPWMLPTKWRRSFGVGRGCWGWGLAWGELCTAASKWRLHLQLGGGNRERAWWKWAVSEGTCWGVLSNGHKPRTQQSQGQSSASLENPVAALQAFPSTAHDFDFVEEQCQRHLDT